MEKKFLTAKSLLNLTVSVNPNLTYQIETETKNEKRVFEAMLNQNVRLFKAHEL